VDASNSIVLQNFSLANLHASDFVIVPPGTASVSMPSGASSGGSTTSAQADSTLGQLVQAMASYSAGSSASDPLGSTQMPGDPSLQNAIGMPAH
jgi:hypothetical protein